MRRYLLVLDMDLLALDEELDLQPINYLAAQSEQQPCEVVVLSMVATRQAKLSPLELALGAATGHAQQTLAKFPTVPQPNHDIHAAAEHRMNRAHGPVVYPTERPPRSATRRPADSINDLATVQRVSQGDDERRAVSTRPIGPGLLRRRGPCRWLRADPGVMLTHAG
jgi:hypothetical protein